MGASIQKCVAAEPPPSDIIDKTPLCSANKILQNTSDTEETVSVEESTEEFISQYGSYFSISSPSEDSHSHSSSIADSDEDDAFSTIDCDASSYTMRTNSSSNVITPVPQETPSPLDDANSFKLFSATCLSINHCKATQRIITALKWHSESVHDDNNHKLLIQKIKENEYDKMLLDDYEHVVRSHLLNTCHIRSEVNTQCTACNCIDGKCITHEQFEEIATKDLSQCDSETFCVYFMNLIHCWVFHSQSCSSH